MGRYIYSTQQIENSGILKSINCSSNGLKNLTTGPDYRIVKHKIESTFNFTNNINKQMHTKNQIFHPNNKHHNHNHHNQNNNKEKEEEVVKTQR